LETVIGILKIVALVAIIPVFFFLFIINFLRLHFFNLDSDDPTQFENRMLLEILQKGVLAHATVLNLIGMIREVRFNFKVTIEVSLPTGEKYQMSRQNLLETRMTTTGILTK